MTAAMVASEEYEMCPSLSIVTLGNMKNMALNRFLWYDLYILIREHFCAETGMLKNLQHVLFMINFCPCEIICKGWFSMLITEPVPLVKLKSSPIAVTSCGIKGDTKFVQITANYTRH